MDDVTVTQEAMIERLLKALDAAEEFEAPAPGIAYGHDILSFPDIRALIAALAASQERLRIAREAEALLEEMAKTQAGDIRILSLDDFIEVVNGWMGRATSILTIRRATTTLAAIDGGPDAG